MKLINLLFCFGLMLATNNLFAQWTVTLSEEVKQALPIQDQAMVARTISSRLADYERLLRNMTDRQTGRVVRDNARAFENLFTLNGKLLNDLREEPEEALIGVIGYLELVEDYFVVDGLYFTLNEAEVTSVEYDPSLSRFTANVIVNKSVENFFTTSGDVESGDRNYDLKFDYTWKRDNPEDARISTISLKSGVFAADYVRILGIGFIGEVGSPQFDLSALWDSSNRETSASIEFNSVTQLGVGANIMTNFFTKKRSSSKNLFLTAGIDLLVSTVEAKMMNYATDAQFDANGQIPGNVLFNEIDRLASNVNATETQELTTLRGAIGLSYRFFSGEKQAGYLSVQYAPSFILSTSGGIDGQGFYNIGKVTTISGETFNFNSAENSAFNPDSDFATSYGISEGEDDLLSFTAAPELSTTISHGILLSATFMRDLLNDSPTYGIALGVQYYLPLTSPIQSRINQEGVPPFLYTNEANSAYYSPGIISTFTDEVRMSTVGLSLKVYLKNTRRP